MEMQAKEAFVQSFVALILAEVVKCRQTLAKFPSMFHEHLSSGFHDDRR